MEPNVLGLPVPSNQVVDDVRMTHDLGNLVVVADVPFLSSYEHGPVPSSVSKQTMGTI
jgi:hypothetical protein